MNVATVAPLAAALMRADAMRVLVLLRPTMARFAPSAASASAAANPMPLVAPVIRIIVYRRRRTSEGICLDFFLPLPQWSERRLMIFGCPVARENSLISYRLSAAEVETEERFLQKRLWLLRSEDSD